MFEKGENRFIIRVDLEHECDWQAELREIKEISRSIVEAIE